MRCQANGRAEQAREAPPRKADFLTCASGTVFSTEQPMSRNDFRIGGIGSGRGAGRCNPR